MRAVTHEDKRAKAERRKLAEIPERQVWQ